MALSEGTSPEREIGLFLDGLRCGGCAHRVERALREAPEIREASVNYTTHRALLRLAPGAEPEAAVAAVEALGYRATPYDPAALAQGDERGAREALARLLVAAFLAMNVMLLAVALYIGGYQDMSDATRGALRWLAIALALPAVAWCALPFWRGALSGLARGEITMDVPVVLGVAVSFALSVAGTLAGADHLFMDSAAMIVFLILLGRTLERRARARAAGAVEALAAVTPARALRVVEGGLEEVEVGQLARGDRIVVPPGETVPVDGRVLRGATELDESLLTGESAPVLREAGDPVQAGTRNVLAEIEIEATSSVETGSVAQLAALLERAQLERPHIQRLADRVATIFAPAVVLLAGATALGWSLAGASALDTALTAAAVLIVACPCALGLATPAAITAAVGRAAGLGLLVKSGEALERGAAVDRVILDKTGTLTEGRFQVESLETAGDSSADELLRTAALAEGASTHPLAEALRRACQARGLVVEPEGSPRAVPGGGVENPLDGCWLRVGSARFLEQRGLLAEPALRAASAKLAAEGQTLAWVARGERVLGVLGLRDPLRVDAAEAVERLTGLGLRVELISGDHAAAVGHAAARARIAAFRAACSPEDKVAHVRARRREGDRILAVGDGINDAAALSSADVGAALCGGSDATLHAADWVVRRPRLGAVADAVELARATLARIRENLALALLYNAVAVPLAVAGVLQPLHAAIAMSLSSLLVTANAVRLLGFRPGGRSAR